MNADSTASLTTYNVILFSMDNFPKKLNIMKLQLISDKR